MKTKNLIVIILLALSISGKSQTFTGTYRNNGASTGSYYTEVFWQISCQFVEDKNFVYLNFFNAKISIPSSSRYHDYDGTEYSLRDLELSSWPQQRQLPFAMRVTFNVTDGYSNDTVTSSCNDDGTCGKVYVPNKSNNKNYNFGNFRIVGGPQNFGVNLGGEGATEAIIKAKKNKIKTNSNSQNSNNTSNNPLGQTSTTTIPENTSGNNPLSNYTPTSTYSNATTEKQVYTQAAVTLAASLIDEMNANYDKKMARWKAESDASLQRSIDRKKERFYSFYNPLIKIAEAGNQDAQMILYLESDNFLAEKVPLRKEWFNKALKDKNATALLAKINNIHYDDFDETNKKLCMSWQI